MADEKYVERLAFLHKWVDAQPKSIMARVAVARCYMNFACHARGYGLANTVTATGWRLFQDRLAEARTVLARLGLSWNNGMMITTVDQQHRAVTPFQPGDVLEIKQPSPDVVVLKRTQQAASTRPNLVRRHGRLVFLGEDTTTDEVNRLLEEFP